MCSHAIAASSTDARWPPTNEAKAVSCVASRRSRRAVGARMGVASGASSASARNAPSGPVRNAVAASSTGGAHSAASAPRHARAALRKTARSVSRRHATAARSTHWARARTASFTTLASTLRAAFTAWSSSAKRRPSARRVSAFAAEVSPAPRRAASVTVSSPRRSSAKRCNSRTGSPALPASSRASRATARSSRSGGGAKPGRGRLSVCKMVRRAPASRLAGSFTPCSASSRWQPSTPTNHGAALRSRRRARASTSAAVWWTTGFSGLCASCFTGLAPRRSMACGLGPTAMVGLLPFSVIAAMQGTRGAVVLLLPSAILMRSLRRSRARFVGVNCQAHQNRANARVFLVLAQCLCMRLISCEYQYREDCF